MKTLGNWLVGLVLAFALAVMPACFAEEAVGDDATVLIEQKSAEAEAEIEQLEAAYDVMSDEEKMAGVVYE